MIERLANNSSGGKSELAALIENKRALAIGPGIGRDDVAKSRLRELGASELPLVVDADALTLLAAQPSL
ncbi:MAG TPA: NAD(P)H-hydrate dehydratase, partial [Polyangia bacterium]|nr:NAD(P)H-hydrate dehydratase [Polyangia bacterium]